MDSSRRKTQIVVILATLLSRIYKSAAQIDINAVVAYDSLSEPYLPVIVKALNESVDITDVQVSSITQVPVDTENPVEDEVCSQIMNADNPPSLLIDATTKPTSVGNKGSRIVKKLARSMGIPTLSVTYGSGNRFAEWMNLNELEQEFLVHVPPPGEVIPQVMRSVATELNLKTAGVFFDDTFVMEHQLSSLLQNTVTRAIMRKVSGKGNSLEQSIEQVASANIPNMFVFASLNTLKNALGVAEKSRIHPKQYAWFFITKETDDLSGSAKNLYVLYMKPKVINANEPLMTEFGTIAPSGPKVDSAFYYDVIRYVLQGIAWANKDGSWSTDITYPSCGESLTDAQKAERTGMKFATAMTQLSPYSAMFGPITVEGNGKNFQRITLQLKQYQWNDDAIPAVEIGSWSFGGLVSYAPGQSMSNFYVQTVYRATTVVQPPFVMKRKAEDGKEEFYGYCIDLLDEIKKLVNFDYALRETEDGMFGIQSDDGKWNGLIGDLVEKRADIAVAPLSVMAERETVVDFTVPFFDLVGISVLMKKPKDNNSMFKFVTVLEASVWACIIAAYFFTSFLLYLFDRLSPYSYYNNKEKYKDDDEKREFNLKESLWFCITSLTPQGGGEAPKNLSGRLVAATWWLFGFIIIASYTANLAAFLTVSRLESPITSLDDLAKQYKVKYGPVIGTSTETYFTRMAYIEEKFYEIWKDMSLDDSLNETERAKLAVWDYPVSDKYTKIWWSMKDARVDSFEEGVKKVKQSKGMSEGFALVADSTQVEYAVMTNCDLQVIGDEFSRKPFALAVQQNSPLKDTLSAAILQLLNMRKLEDLKDKWFTRNPDRLECSDDKKKKTDGIGIDNIGGVFFVIVIGLGSAILVLVIEFFFYQHKSASKRVVAVKEYGSGEPKARAARTTDTIRPQLSKMRLPPGH